MTKNDIVHYLAEKMGYRRCLVLRTQLTGPDCKIDPKRFDVYTEIKYQCPGSELGTQGYTLPECDIALIDPWHTYEHSMRDLLAVSIKLARGGALVCHDCWPPESITNPNDWPVTLQKGQWSGETYKAWMDFANICSFHPYWTIDTDYGCGVMINKLCQQQHYDLFGHWNVHHSYQFLANEGRPLLNLITPDDFRALDFGTP